MAWTWLYSSSYNFGGYKEYRAWIGYDQANYDTYSRCWWSIGVQMKYGSLYGVQATASGAASGSCEGYLSSSPGGTWTDVCRKDSYFDVTRTTSKQTKTVTSTAKGKTVSGYGSAGGSGVSKSYTYTIPALASYTVSFNANGGSGAPASQTKYYGKTLTLSSTKPSKSGYTFLGWATSSSATSYTYSAGGSYNANSGATLYAVWRKTITLSYNSNGGTSAPTAQSANVYNSTTSHTFTISSSTPTLDGYNFKGWSTSSTATSASYQPSSTITLSSNSTLYAVWELAYIPPKIGRITTYRTDNEGTAADEGTYAHIDFTWSVDSAHEAVIDHIYIDSRIKGDSNWTRIWSGTPNSDSGSVNVNVSFPTTGFDVNYSYDLLVTVADDVGQSTASSFVSQAFFTIDINSEGTGIAFGAPASDTTPMFYCAMNMYVKNKTTGDPISLLDVVYPVGSIYMSVNNVNPSTILGGTWARIKDKFLLAAGDTYSAGGGGGAASQSYTPAGTVGNHTLTTNEIPAHYHQIRYQNSSGSSGAGYSWGGSKMSWSAATESSTGMKGAGGGGAHNHGFTGTAATINTMPPYLTVYMWKRTA